MPPILLSGFADESANQKTLDQQFSAFAAMGLRYFSIRFLDAGNGIKNVMALDEAEIKTVQEKMSEYHLSVSSLGSPIGKVKLCDIDDGTQTPYRNFDRYLAEEVPRACELANRFDTKLIRGFSFYHPRGSDLQTHLAQATDQVGKIADTCARHGLVFGLEVEANLIGQNGSVLAKMHRDIGNEALVLIFDGGNLVVQGYSAEEIFQQYVEMKPGLGWLHIKDFSVPEDSRLSKAGHVDEEAIKHFVPVDSGDAGHANILLDLAGFLPELNQRMISKGVDGVFVDLEPHVKGGGQFGGFSGPDGFGVALRALCSMCDATGVNYQLRDFNDIRACRGF